MDGTITCGSSLTGTLKGRGIIGGTVAGTASLTGAIQGKVSLAGTSAGSSALQAGYRKDTAGTVPTASSLMGGLIGIQTVNIAGTAAGSTALALILDADRLRVTKLSTIATLVEYDSAFP